MTHPGLPGNADTPSSPLADPAVCEPPATSSVTDGKNHDRTDEFSSFYLEHFRRLVAYLIYQGATTHLAADLAQETMTTAYRRWPEITSPKAYVYTVAGRAFIRHSLKTPEVPAGDALEPTTVLPRPDAAEAWVQAQQITQVLRALPSRQRQVLALTIYGWSPAEIAGLLDIAPSAVRSNLMKARRGADEHRRRIEEEPS